MDVLEQLGSEAYQKGLWGDYKGAISLLDKAIIRYPTDARLYNNRSYYYLKLKNYNGAISDAESMLKLYPSYVKGYFRKAEVLMELKRYEEAENVFRVALELDPANEEVKFWLLESQICQFTNDGNHLIVDVKTALELNNYNTTQAKAFITVGGMTDASIHEREDMYYSDDDSDIPPARAHVDPPITTLIRPSDIADNDPHTDPNNPLKSNSLWVGNITKSVQERHLEPLFSKYGKIGSIMVQRQQHCAFVNYTHHSMATNAMRRFPQMIPIEDTFLVIKFPESAKTKHVSIKSSKKPAKKKKQV